MNEPRGLPPQVVTGCPCRNLSPRRHVSRLITKSIFLNGRKSVAEMGEPPIGVEPATYLGKLPR